MRLLALLAAMLLAACNGPGEVNRSASDTGEGNAAGAPPAASQPAPAPAPTGNAALPAATEAAAIPSAFHGVYDESLASCGTPSQARMEIRSGELRFHESTGVVRKVTIAAPDQVSVTAHYQGEGESWRSVRELRLSDGGSTVTVSGDGTSLVRRRCPPA